MMMILMRKMYVLRPDIAGVELCLGDKDFDKDLGHCKVGNDLILHPALEPCVFLKIQSVKIPARGFLKKSQFPARGFLKCF